MNNSQVEQVASEILQKAIICQAVPAGVTVEWKTVDGVFTLEVKQS